MVISQKKVFKEGRSDLLGLCYQDVNKDVYLMWRSWETLAIEIQIIREGLYGTEGLYVIQF